MTSKEKLIEFLKSADIEFQEKLYGLTIIETAEMYYYFDLEGNFLYNG